MRKAIVRRAAIGFTLALAWTWAGAQSPSPAMRPSASFICGGVGQAEQERMKSEAPRHDLMLTFAVTGGAYLADIDVQIRDGKGGIVLEARCGGPIMLVDLPVHGNWHVTAQSNGRSLEKTIAAGAGQSARATFVWPAGA